MTSASLYMPIELSEAMMVFYNKNRFNMYDMPQLNDNGDRRVWRQYDIEMKNLYGVERNDELSELKNEMIDEFNTFFQELYEMMDNSDDDFSVVEGGEEEEEENGLCWDVECIELDEEYFKSLDE